MKSRAPSLLGRFLRVYLWALLAALVVGFAIGLVIRERLERPRTYLGALLDVGDDPGTGRLFVEPIVGLVHAECAVGDLCRTVLLLDVEA